MLGVLRFGVVKKVQNIEPMREIRHHKCFELLLSNNKLQMRKNDGYIELMLICLFGIGYLQN